MATYLNHLRGRFYNIGGKHQVFPVTERSPYIISYPEGGFANVTPSATANVKGNYTEFCSSTPEDAIINSFCFCTYGTSGTNYCADIALGAVGSESILVNNLHFQNHFSKWPLEDAYLPIFIPKGSRISVRAQANQTSRFLYNGSIELEYNSKRLNGDYFTKCLTLGAITSGATDLSYTDPNAAANVYGNWVEYTSAMPYTTKGLLIMISSLGNPSRTNDTNWRVQVGIGPSGSEQPIIDSMVLYFKTETLYVLPMYRFYNVTLPYGSRVSVRYRCNNVSNSWNRTVGIGLYCFA